MLQRNQTQLGAFYSEQRDKKSAPLISFDKKVIRGNDSYLVDSASSHMLVFKIKPCMSKYKQYIP